MNLVPLCIVWDTAERFIDTSLKMTTVLTKRIYTSASETSSNDSLGAKEPKVRTTAVDIPLLGVPQEEKRFWWQRVKVGHATI
jgi:hypothetical protein